MPFITEELWHALAARDHDLIVARWPAADARAIDPQASAEVEWLIGFIRELRATRTAAGIPSTSKISLEIRRHTPWQSETFIRYGAAAKRLANIGELLWLVNPTSEEGQIEGIEVAQGDKIQFLYDDMFGYFELEGVIDLAAERARLAKAAEAAEKERDGLAARLANPAFVEKAKPEAVAKAREDHDSKAAEADRLRAALARLG